jgi:hypothetical protein
LGRLPKERAGGGKAESAIGRTLNELSPGNAPQAKVNRNIFGSSHFVSFGVGRRPCG